MDWQLTPFTVPLALAALVTLVIVVPVYRNRQKRTAVPLLAYILLASVYGIGVGIRLSVVTLDAKLFWNIVAQVGRAGTPIALFLLAASFTDRRQWFRRRRLGALAAIWAVQILLPVFNPADAVFESTRLVTRDGLAFLAVEFGPFVPVTVATSYLFLSVGTYWLLSAYWEARASESVYTRQIGLVILAILIPWGTNALTVFGVTLVDYSPFGYTATSVLIATALFRYRLLDIRPIARGTVVESMDNGVFVLDADGRIVDTNPQARETIAPEAARLVGRPFGEVFASSPAIVEAVEESTETVEESVRTVDDSAETSDQLSITEDGTRRHYEVTVSPIEDSFGNDIGRTVVFNDITGQVEREQDLDLMRQVLSRVLRHNMRNELQVVQGCTAMLASELDGRNREIATKAHTGASDLVSLSNKARGIETLVEADHTATELDLVALLRDALDNTHEEFPDLSVTAELPDSCEVRVTPAIHLAFENLLENAVEHGSTGNRNSPSSADAAEHSPTGSRAQPDDAAEHDTSQTPTVDVTLSRTDGHVDVTISDNGPGIPSHELAVLDNEAETDLEHGSGLGLWIVNWVIDDSRASVQYDTDTGGTDVTVRIPS